MSLPGYNFLVSDPEILNGKPVVRGTRLSAAFILSCLSEGMAYEEIVSTYAPFPQEAIAEILKLASGLLEASCLQSHAYENIRSATPNIH